MSSYVLQYSTRERWHLYSVPWCSIDCFGSSFAEMVLSVVKTHFVFSVSSIWLSFFIVWFIKRNIFTYGGHFFAIAW